MTPEKDVKTDAEQNLDSVIDESPDGHKAVSDAAAAHSNPTGQDKPAEDAGTDDPLGFGDQRMPSSDDPADADSDAPDHAESAQAADADPAIDSETGEPLELDELDQLKVQLAEAEAKASEHWDRLLRLQADMENQRKRAQNDVNKARKFALEGIVSDLLPVKDSLEMGLAVAEGQEPDVKSLREGSELTLKMLAQVFEKNNILEVNPIDEKFDPEFHQAMSMQEIDGKDPNTVAGVMQKGYTLNDRLVRPALVMVAK